MISRGGVKESAFQVHLSHGCLFFFLFSRVIRLGGLSSRPNVFNIVSDGKNEAVRLDGRTKGVEAEGKRLFLLFFLLWP